jgi:hypothetical protein
MCASCQLACAVGKTDKFKIRLVFSPPIGNETFPCAKVICRAGFEGMVKARGSGEPNHRLDNIYSSHFQLMTLSSLVIATDGTIRATTWVGLLYEATLLGHHLQGRYNRAKPKTKKSAFTIDYKFDGETTSLVAKVNLEGQRLAPVAGAAPKFKLDSIFGDYIVDANGVSVPFSGGTGVLTGIDTFEEALLYIAENVSYLESQIEPDQLLKEINIVNVTPTPEDGNETLDISIPLRNGWDEAIGQASIKPKNYLYIIDVPDTEAI